MFYNAKTINFTILILIIFFIALPVLAGNSLSAAIVPCGLAENDPDTSWDDTKACELCHFFSLAKNISNFFIKDITPAAAVLFFVWGAVLLIISGTSEQASLRAQGKKIMTNTVYGILIVFSAWIIVNTTLNLLIGQSSDVGTTAGQSGSSFPWPWANPPSC